MDRAEYGRVIRLARAAIVASRARVARTAELLAIDARRQDAEWAAVGRRLRRQSPELFDRYLAISKRTLRSVRGALLD